MKHNGMSRQGGFTIIEIGITLVILGVLMAAGLPSLFAWLGTSRANSAPVFYMEGIRLAREGAIKNNAAARFTLIPNSSNGQYDWRVDWCSPTTTAACDDGSGKWSTTASPVSTASGEPSGPSILRTSEGLPSSQLLGINSFGENDVYFDSVGWLNSNATNLTKIQFIPSSTDSLPTQININLSGMVERCVPTVGSSDSRACP
jgi:type IV fimbrial biogenesis protein FimT